MSEGVRHGEKGHVVHSLPLEKSLPAIHRLNPHHPLIAEKNSPSASVSQRWTLPLRRLRGFNLMKLSGHCYPQTTWGLSDRLASPNPQKENKLMKKKL